MFLFFITFMVDMNIKYDSLIKIIFSFFFLFTFKAIAHSMTRSEVENEQLIGMNNR